jgi:hypothetical protein
MKLWPFGKKKQGPQPTHLPKHLQEFEKRFNYICQREKVTACYIALDPEEQQIIAGGNVQLRELVRKKFEKG